MLAKIACFFKRRDQFGNRSSGPEQPSRFWTNHGICRLFGGNTRTERRPLSAGGDLGVLPGRAGQQWRAICLLVTRVRQMTGFPACILKRENILNYKHGQPWAKSCINHSVEIMGCRFAVKKLVAKLSQHRTDEISVLRSTVLRSGKRNVTEV